MDMNVEKRPLYNLLRMHWLNDPSIEVKPWQVEDYRVVPLTTLFDRLQPFSIFLDKTNFATYTEETDSPEEFVEYLIADKQLNAEKEDQIYLLIFELWRRLKTEKPTLSIICDELDDQIYRYDQGQLTNPNALQNALTNFLAVLEENVDAGIDPKDALKTMASFCANDVETFLFDFISEQIENENDFYAQELMDDFGPFFEGDKWFNLLKIKLLSRFNMKTAYRELGDFIDEFSTDQLEFALEVLSLLAGMGTTEQFNRVIRQTLPLLNTEEDFQDLLAICTDYLHRLDEEEKEKAIQHLQLRRAKLPLDGSFRLNDPDLPSFLAILGV